MILPFNTFTLHSLMGFMVTAALAVMFYVVYLKAGRRLIDVLSANFILCVSCMCAVYFLMDNLVPAGMSATGWLNGPTPDDLKLASLGLTRWAWVFGILLLPAQLHFVLHYCQKQNLLRRYIWVTYALAVMTVPAVLFTDLFAIASETPGAETSSWMMTIPWLPQIGPAAALPSVCCVAMEIYCLVLLWRTKWVTDEAAESLGARRIVFFAFVVQMAATLADGINGALALPVPTLTPLGSGVMGVLLAAALIRSRIATDRARFQLSREKASLLECIPQPLLYLGDDLRVHWSNAAASSLSSESTGPLEGKRVDEIWPADSLELEAVAHALTTGESTEREIVRQDGSTWVVYASAVLDKEGDPMGAIMLAMDITDIRMAQKSLRENNIKILSAREEERRRVAQDLHDSVAQGLTALVMHLRSNADTLGTDTPEGGHFVKASERCAALGKEVRCISHDLYPPALDLLGFSSAVEDILEQYRLSGVECAFACPDDLRRVRFGQGVEVSLYRTVQEAINNATRHGHATSIAVQVQRSDQDLCLTITDNGAGFDVGTTKQGLGMSSMRGRVEGIDGEFAIESRPGRTRVTVTVPNETLEENAPQPAAKMA